MRTEGKGPRPARHVLNMALLLCTSGRGGYVLRRVAVYPALLQFPFLRVGWCPPGGQLHSPNLLLLTPRRHRLRHQLLNSTPYCSRSRTCQNTESSEYCASPGRGQLPKSAAADSSILSFGRGYAPGRGILNLFNSCHWTIAPPSTTSPPHVLALLRCLSAVYQQVDTTGCSVPHILCEVLS